MWLDVPENAKARFFSSVLKDAIEFELDKLVSQRVFEPINHFK